AVSRRALPATDGRAHNRAGSDSTAGPGARTATPSSTPSGAPWTTSLGSAASGCRVFAYVADQADHVFGDEPTDGAAGVHANHHLAGLVEDDAGGLQKNRVSIKERTGEARDGSGVCAVPDREGQAVLGDQLGSSGLVVYRQR